MRSFYAWYNAALLSGLLLLSPVLHAEDVRKLDDISFDGLSLVKESRHRVVYVDKSVVWANYNEIMLQPPQVAFRKNWQRNQNQQPGSTGRRVSDKDVLKLKNGVADMLSEIFNQQLAASRFKIVSEANANTLIIKPSVINLDIAAPDLKAPGMDRTYVHQVGSGVLYLELYDATSGNILARALDYRETIDRGYMVWANRMQNRADAEKVITAWAKQLIETLDELTSPEDM